MEQFMGLLDLNGFDQKRKMGRPPKISPYSHYDAYKKEDVDTFISLFSGRVELYNPCEEFNELRQRAFYFIEKKCGHFMAMRKGRNAEKLWLYLFNDFEKFIRNGGDRNDERSKPIAAFYDSLKFLIPYIEKTDDVFLPKKKSPSSNEMGIEAKRPRIEEEPSNNQLNAEWLQKVIETVIYQQPTIPVYKTDLPNETTELTNDEADNSTKLAPITTIEKHADIVTCVINFLNEVPNEKLMLSKVRLFQFLQEERIRLMTDK